MAVMLAFVWAVRFYGHNAGGATHLLLVSAVIAAYISIWKVNLFKRV